MCLRANSEVKINFVNGRALLYKLVEIREGRYYSPLQGNTEYLLGEEVVSNRTSKQFNEVDDYILSDFPEKNAYEKGIHTFLRKEDVDYALQSSHGGEEWQPPSKRRDFVILEVECLESDLVATGYTHSYVAHPEFSEPSAVFIKVKPIRVLPEVS